MKKIAIIIACLFAVVLTTSAQTNAEIAAVESNPNIETENFFQNLYIGSLNSTMFNSSGYTATSSLRVGAAKDFALGKKANIRLAGTYDNGLGCTINQVSLGFDIKNVKIQAGLIPRPITLHRPYPPTGASHFEPPALRKIPGASIGVNAVTSLNNGDQLLAGLYEGNGRLQLNAGYMHKLDKGSLRISAYYRNLENAGIAATLKNNSGSQATAFVSDEWASILLIGNVKDYFSAYLTTYFDRYEGTDHDNLEIGITKNFLKELNIEGLKANALIGAGYVIIPEQTFNVYFQFYFDI